MNAGLYSCVNRSVRLLTTNLGTRSSTTVTSEHSLVGWLLFVSDRMIFEVCVHSMYGSWMDASSRCYAAFSVIEHRPKKTAPGSIIMLGVVTSPSTRADFKIERVLFAVEFPFN